MGLSPQQIKDLIDRKVENIKIVEADLKIVKHERSKVMIESHLAYLNKELESIKYVYGIKD